MFSVLFGGWMMELLHFNFTNAEKFIKFLFRMVIKKKNSPSRQYEIFKKCKKSDEAVTDTINKLLIVNKMLI